MSENIIWAYFLGCSAGRESAVRALLGLTGLAVRECGPETAQAYARLPGVIVFEEYSPRVVEAVRHMSGTGNGRVLVLCASEDELAGDAAWAVLGAGASDVLHAGSCHSLPDAIRERFERWNEVDGLLESPSVTSTLIGESAALRAVLRQVVEVARFTDSSIVVTGESGTGKELVARLVHKLDPRPDKGTLVILDCTTIVPELSGSEFFGHERGSFTGAVGTRDGAFSLADGGTLFLDEVGELPLELQSKLLRVIQEGTFKRVGGNTWFETSFRLVCATNRDLEELVVKGAFRQDLYYRISEWTCKLPPLKERPEDILPLVMHFMGRCTDGREPPVLDAPVREYFLRREYKGNVRELKQLVSRVMCRHTGSGPLTVGSIPEDDRLGIEVDGLAQWQDSELESSIRKALHLGAGMKEIGRIAENMAIRLMVRDERGNVRRAATRLGVSDRTLHMRLAELKQPPPPN